MLKKILALATSTAMLVANAAAYALNDARAAVRTVTGAGTPSTAVHDGNPGVPDGRSILPSIPPLPPEPAARKPATRPAVSPASAGRKITKARAHGKKAAHRKARKTPR